MSFVQVRSLLTVVKALDLAAGGESFVQNNVLPTADNVIVHNLPTPVRVTEQ
jgi:hypothetical protein